MWEQKAVHAVAEEVDELLRASARPPVGASARP